MTRRRPPVGWPIYRCRAAWPIAAAGAFCLLLAVDLAAAGWLVVVLAGEVTGWW